MSADAKSWKRSRLRELGVRVVEHAGDYADAVATARARFSDLSDAHFVDDEHSETLFVGYATAAYELAGQLTKSDVEVSAERPLIVYLPCGVGGAPGGITFGLKAIFGDHVRCVLVEPIASASMLATLAFPEKRPVSVYALGLNNRTVADGLATPVASQLVVDLIGPDIDAVLALPDSCFLDWVGRAWEEARLRLEPSATAGFAAFEHLDRASRDGTLGDPLLCNWSDATHIVWTTGGAMLPDEDFARLLRSADGDAVDRAPQRAGQEDFAVPSGL